MRIKEVAFENFRGFKGLHSVEMPKGNIAVVIGTNGAGKTSFLDAIMCPMILFINSMLDISKEFDNTYQKDIHQDTEGYEISLGLEVEWLNKAEEEIIRLKQSKDSKRKFTRQSERNIKHPLKNALLNNKNNIPIFAFYQTDRNFSKNSKVIYNRSDIFSDVSNISINYKSIEDWFIRLVNRENALKILGEDLKYELPLFKAIKTALTNYLEILLNTDIELQVVHDYINPKLYIYKENTLFDFFQLSAGERMILGMVLDIAYKMAIANPQLDNPLLTHGIVLIDEIELHLHPKWQMSVLDALSSTFPNVQFIVTTHSPLVINHVSNEQLIILDNFKIISGKEVHNTYGRDVNTIIEDFMGGLERPVTIKKQIKKIEDALDAEKPNLKKARKYLEELKQKIDPNDYELLKLDTLITIEEADEVYQKTS